MQETPSSSSRALIILLSLAAVCMVLGLLALLAAAASVFTAPRPVPTPTVSTTATSIAAAPQRLAVIDGDHLYTINADGTDRLELQHNGQVPTAALIWSHDGQRLIFAEIERNTSRLISARPDGQDAIVLYEGDRLAAPFYLYGAPDDRRVAFLVSEAVQGMALKIAETDRASSARSAVRGQPNYASWSPDSQSLVVHIGGTSADAFVGTYALSDTRPLTIETNLAPFQAPFWSPTGTTAWLYARQKDAGGELVIGNGQQITRVAEFDDGIAFGWSPDGRRVAYTLNAPSAFLYQGLTVVDLDKQSSHIYYEGNIVCFFWSPDGQKVAFLTGALVEPAPVGRANGWAIPSVQQRTLQLTWHVLDLQKNSVIDLNTFEPTESFIYLIQYFDQFAQSVAVWSPDSRWLAYAGHPLVGARGAYLVDTQHPTADPRYIGPGDFAIWSWK